MGKHLSMGNPPKGLSKTHSNSTPKLTQSGTPPAAACGYLTRRNRRLEREREARSRGEMEEPMRRAHKLTEPKNNRFSSCSTGFASAPHGDEEAVRVRRGRRREAGDKRGAARHGGRGKEMKVKPVRTIGLGATWHPILAGRPNEH